MVQKIQVPLTAQSLKIAVVLGRFNQFITSKLWEGAMEHFLRLQGSEENLTQVWVPGAFEIPLSAKLLAESGQYDAVVALGAVIRGATAHFDHVAGQCAAGLNQVSLSTQVPVIFGVLTTDTIEQAIERAGTKAGNKGQEAMEAAIEMAALCRQLKEL